MDITKFEEKVNQIWDMAKDNKAELGFARAVAEDIRKHTQTEFIRLREDIKGLKEDLENKYVSKAEFEGKMAQFDAQLSPLKSIVYGIIAIGGTAVVGAIISLVIK